MLPAKRQNVPSSFFTSALLLYLVFCSSWDFLCGVGLTRAAPCLLPDFRGKDICLLHLVLAIGFLYIAFTMLSYVPSITSFFGGYASWRDMKIHQRIFLHLIKRYLCSALSLLICVYWTNLAFLEMKQIWSYGIILTCIYKISS